MLEIWAHSSSASRGSGRGPNRGHSRGALLARHQRAAKLPRAGDLGDLLDELDACARGVLTSHAEGSRHRVPAVSCEASMNESQRTRRSQWRRSIHELRGERAALSNGQAPITVPITGGYTARVSSQSSARLRSLLSAFLEFTEGDLLRSACW